MNISEYNRCVNDVSDGLYRFLLKNTKESELARDLVQESFMRLWERHKDVDAEKGKSWLFTTAYRAMIDHIRKFSRMETLEPEKHRPEATGNGYSDLKEILNRAVEQLPEMQRSVILLRDYEGYSYREIGEITGLGESQVKVYIFRARLFLKKFIGKPEYVI
jgi:RNA polymerase sigma-70 factor (ECF subfamily)